ncbi:MAG TPA: putative 2OG-Fe(II) oxygenase [Allosphingosinicella sp.]|nr:putative 2OG-Fe(II) oxygenase [Allosphingosinicella sp.]
MTGETALLLRSVSPGDANAVFAAGAKAVKSGLEAEALPLLEQAAQRHPGDPRIWQVLGLANRKLEDLAPAVAAFEKAAGLAPNDPLIAHSLARCTMEAGLPSVALFDRALALAPNDGSVLLGRAAAQLAVGRIEDAIAGLAGPLAQQPGWLPGHASIARLRWLAGERRDFTASFEAAVAAAPRETAIWREWAETLMHAGHYDAALAVAAGGRAAAGPDVAFDAIEAVAVDEKGEIDAADALFTALGPIGHVTMAARYLRHLLRAGRPAEAATFAEPWLADPEADLVWPYVAAAWRLTGDPRWQWLEGDERLVGVYDIADEIPSLDGLAATLRSLHQSLHQPLEQSVRGGTQTDGPLFARIEPEIRALRQAIVAAVERHIAQLPPPQAGHPSLAPKRAPVRLAGSWSVRLAGAGFHSNHIHPAGWISSAFYVALPDMDRGHEGWLKLGEPQAELGLDLAPFRHIEPKPGLLVLFPSTMWHGTEPFTAGERMTVAFDVARPA